MGKPRKPSNIRTAGTAGIASSSPGALLLLAAGIVAAAYFLITPAYLFPDGQGYFSYLPSLLYDGDLDLFNEFSAMKIPVPMALTDTGYISNIWSFGASFFWMPFYAAGKLFADIGEAPHGSWFWLWVNAGTVFYGFLTWFLLVRLLDRAGVLRGRVALAACAFLGTSAFFYTFVMPGTAHGISAFAATALLWYWLSSLEHYRRPWRYAVLGILAGMTAMVRPQEALFALPVITELVFRAGKRELPLRESFRALAVFGAGALAGASPQLIVWKIVYGSFFAAPAKFNLAWSYFALPDVLFSSYHGLLFWTPVVFVAFAGLLAGMLRRPMVFTGLLLVFLGQVLVNSCCVAYWEGYSFGLRQMTSSLPIVTLGLGSAYTSFASLRDRRLAWTGWLIIALPVAWTMGLLVNYYLGLDLLGYLSPSEIWQAQRALPGRIFEFPGRFLSSSRPPLPMFTVGLMFAGILLVLLRQLYLLLLRGKAFAAGVLLLAIAASCDALLIAAYRNKPARRAPEAQFITQRELDEFFVRQVQEIKEHYKLQ